MPRSIVDIYRESGDDHIGQTLVRLAGLAASAHRFEAARRIADPTREDRQEAHGSGLGPSLTQRRAAESIRHRVVRTEVDR